jgi:hypothetical protein
VIGLSKPDEPDGFARCGAKLVFLANPESVVCPPFSKFHHKSSCFHGKNTPIPVVAPAQISADDFIFANTWTSAASLKVKAVGHLVRCLFRDASEGGISAVDSLGIFINSWRFGNCTVDISTHTTSNVISRTVNKHSATAVVCSKESQVWVRSSVVASGAIDAHDKAELHFDRK